MDSTWAPHVYAHRFGGSYGPECSREALDRTLDGPVDGLEADVVLTADEEVVACHDPLLQISTADLRGWAHEHASGALTRARLLDGRGEPSDETPLTLREVLDEIPSGLPLQLDVKAFADPGLARRTAERCCEIAHDADRGGQIEVISFFTPACEAAVAHGVRSRLVVWAEYEPRTLAKWARDRGIQGLSFEGFILDRTLREVARDADLTISVGAVNTAEQLQRLMALEPEILVSDCPHEIRTMLDERAQPAGEQPQAEPSASSPT